jgi:hypothetical protein
MTSPDLGVEHFIIPNKLYVLLRKLTGAPPSSTEWNYCYDTWGHPEGLLVSFSVLLSPFILLFSNRKNWNVQGAVCSRATSICPPRHRFTWNITVTTVYVSHVFFDELFFFDKERQADGRTITTVCQFVNVSLYNGITLCYEQDNRLIWVRFPAK